MGLRRQQQQRMRPHSRFFSKLRLARKQVAFAAIDVKSDQLKKAEQLSLGFAGSDVLPLTYSNF